MVKRIDKGALYLVERDVPGRHGGGTARCIMRGEFARAHRSGVVRRFKLADEPNMLVRVENGRLPEFQPVMKVGAFVGDFWTSHNHVAVIVTCGACARIGTNGGGAPLAHSPNCPLGA